jgi:hypothetical protein
MDFFVIMIDNINIYLLIMIDTIGKRVAPVYQGLRAIASLIPQSGDENSFVGIYASNSLCKFFFF